MGLNKYSAKRTELAGRSFASRGEADCFLYLNLLEKTCEIKNLECQVTVRLPESGGLRFVLDFKYWDLKLNAPVWADFKGFPTQRWLDCKKLWHCCGPGLLRVYKGRGMRMLVAEEIQPRVHEDTRDEEIAELREKLRMKESA